MSDLNHIYSGPDLTIVTVVRNSVPELKKTITSVSGQKYPHIAFIVIDGGSTDDTKEVIKTHANHIAYWISEPDRGPYDAMNKGLAQATGEWILFLNAGDTFADPSILSRIFANDMSECDVIYGDCIRDYRSFKVLQKAASPEQLWKGMICSHQSMFIRTSLMKPQGFISGYKIGADYEFAYRLFAAGKRFYYFSE